MFSFFNKKKASITSINIPTFGWKKIESNESIIEWINPEHSIALSVNFFNIPPDIPTMSNIGVLRESYRNAIAAVGGGIIEVDILKVKDIAVLKTIFKIPQKPRGMTYLASLTIPFENCSFVLKAQCAEIGVTGARDSVILAKKMSSGEVSIEDGLQSGWFYDPYDENIKEGILMNKSEQSIYDEMFPEHPLTQARKIIEKLSAEVLFKPEIEKLKPFKK